MQKILAIALIAVHLFGNTEVGQIIKLPKLISHYFQHHRQNPDINFFDFLAMHYGGDDGTVADDDLDNQLPCHNLNHNCLSVVYPPIAQDIFNLEAIQYKNAEYGRRLLTGIPSKHVLLILQPPRKA